MGENGMRHACRFVCLPSRSPCPGPLRSISRRVTVVTLGGLADHAPDQLRERLFVLGCRRGLVQPICRSGEGVRVERVEDGVGGACPLKSCTLSGLRLGGTRLIGMHLVLQFLLRRWAA